MKKLTKIRLINWHRFTNETIPVGDSVLLSGENGAGKSTILDAVQFVLTCSKANFNKAAHEKGKRTLNTYIRCKTGREDRPYERTGSITSHIALEFMDEGRKAPFIVGVVMDSATEEKEPNTLWYLIEKKNLKDELFFQGKKVKTISMFRSSNRMVRTFATTNKEARRMMLARFGRLEDKFFTLIPKALAFRPIHDIKDFVYSYVLDAKEVNIDSLRENVRSYQHLEKMLADVRCRIKELSEIIEKEKAVETFSRREKYQDYYIALADRDIVSAGIRANRQTARTKERELEETEKRQQELLGDIRVKEQTIRDLDLELNMDEEYKAFRDLERKEKQLKEQLDQDRHEMKKLKASIRAALKDAEWILKIPDADPVMEEYQQLLKDIEKIYDLTPVYTCLEKVMDYKKDRYQKIMSHLAEVKYTLRQKREEKMELEGQIRELSAKRMIYPENVQRLKRSIEAQFARMGRDGDVRILSELLEIKDSTWQNAVEGYLNTQRFYLIVSPEDFDLALSVYDNQRKKKKAYGVGLINAAKLDGYDQAPEESLAAHVYSASIWARRYINMVLGKVRCVESTKQLKKYPISITKGCMRYQNHVASAIRPEIYRTPYIGADAIRIQLEQKKKERDELEHFISDKNAQMEAMERVQRYLDSGKEVDVKYQLRALEEKRNHEKDLKKCREEMSKIDASRTLIEKRIRLEELKREKDQLDREKDKLSERIGGYRTLLSSLADRLEELNRELSIKKAAAGELGELLGQDRQYCEGEYEKEIEKRDRDQESLIRKKENYERARKASETQKNAALSQMSELMRVYKVAHDFGAADTLAGFPEFEKEYDKLKNSRLLEYEDKVYQARKAAEEEFREQFLSRLQENIRQAQGEFKDLNRSLKDIHFSREQYEFRYEPRREVKKYYEMIMDDFNIMEGTSIFSGIFNDTHKEVIEELFEKLTLDDETSSRALQEYTDYRTYMDYDIKITSEDGSYMYYSKVSREKSGGETQTPFYITVAASFMQLYRGSIGGDSIGLVMMDEAFNNMDDERISGVLSFMSQSNLQTIIAAPPDKIQYIGPAVSQVLLTLTDGEASYVEEFSRGDRGRFSVSS
ncbi:MAG: hypothetical protein IJI25_02220 [Eubacterium sp.]|nr:hypothetical protein [Eubacterium sp.]